MKPAILFTSPWGPHPKTSLIDDPIDTFYYRNTFKQKVFQLRAFQSWHSLHFIAQNIPIPSVVLESPLQKEFKNEVNHGKYEVIAIGFTMLLTHRVLEMVKWLRASHPETEIILGGYGTSVFSETFTEAIELKSLVDGICFGDGIPYFRDIVKRKWGIDSQENLKQDLLPAENSLFRTRIKIFRQIILVSSLGCLNGCSFCSTSTQFNHKYIQLFNARELFIALLDQVRKHPRIESAIIYNENFLQHRNMVLEFMKLFENSALSNRPFLLTVFSSVHAVSQYSIEELIRCGIGTIFIGVESLNQKVIDAESLKKRNGDAEKLFETLHRHGINTLGSMIVGWDRQSIEDVQFDADNFIQMNPTFYQVIPLHPSPGTPLWERIKKEGRLIKDYRFEKDGISRFNFETQQYHYEKGLNVIANTYTKLVEEGGPWPFRMFENQLEGFLNLRLSENPALERRSEIYRSMLLKISLLAVTSRFYFHGKGFKTRWGQSMSRFRKNFPMAYILNIMLSPFIFLILSSIYLIGSIVHFLKPNGDQPNKIRREYGNI